MAGSGIGLKHFVVAKIATETPGQAITYSAGMVMGKAIRAEISRTRNDNPLYADDGMAENDNGMTGGTIEMETASLDYAVRAYMLGDEVITVGTGSATTTEYEITDDPAPYVGVGYLRVLMKNGEKIYEARWIYKAQFAENNVSAQTKAEQITWQTPTIIGKIMAVQIDASGKNRFERYADEFTTEAQAAAWLDAKAGITPQTNG